MQPAKNLAIFQRWSSDVINRKLQKKKKAFLELQNASAATNSGQNAPDIPLRFDDLLFFLAMTSQQRQKKQKHTVRHGHGYGIALHRRMMGLPIKQQHCDATRGFTLLPPTTGTQRAKETDLAGGGPPSPPSMEPPPLIEHMGKKTDARFRSHRSGRTKFQGVFPADLCLEKKKTVSK